MERARQNSSFYTQEELLTLGFKSVGKNVLISKKSSIYGAENISIGNFVRIDDFCLLTGKIELANYIHVAPFSGIFGHDQGVFFDDFSAIASRGHIFAHSDDYSGESLTNPMTPVKFKNVKNGPVFLGKHVIVGTNSTILPGVTIGDGTAISAHSLVKSSLESWGIYAGVPCIKIKDRSKELLKLEAKFLKNMSF
ncbi:MAG: acyltransferase [Eubacteriales bacterium]